MVDLLKAELLKLRRSKMVLLSLIGAALSPLMVVLAYYMNRNEEAITFDELLFNTSLYSVLLIGVPLYSLITAYLFHREYAEDTLKSLLTIPISRMGLICSKMLLLLLWVMALTFVSWVLTIVFGTIAQFEGLDMALAAASLQAFFKAGFMLFALSTPIMYVTLATKHYVPAIIAAIAVNLVSVLIFNSEHRGLLPWTAAFDLAHGILMPTYPAIVSYLIIAATSVSGLIAAFIYFRRVDIQS